MQVEKEIQVNKFLTEQNENDINKAQVNILLSLSKVLNCSIEDLLN